MTGFEDTPQHRTTERSVLAYAIYSNRKSAMASRYAAAEFEKWAKSEGFNFIHAYSGRTSGSAIKWAKQFHGLELEKLFLSKKI